MQTVVVSPPAPWGADELALVKQHLNVEHDDHDELIAAYVAAALGNIDGPDGWLGRALRVQTLEARLERFPGGFIPLSCPPFLEVASVTYEDPAGEEQTLDPAAYVLDLDGLRRKGAAAWPTTSGQRGAVRVRYSAGYEVLPPPIRSAVWLMVGDLYANRETVTASPAGKVPMSTTVENLLAAYRMWRV